MSSKCFYPFGRALDYPFEHEKVKISGVRSALSPKTADATLNVTVQRAVNMYLDCIEHSEGAKAGLARFDSDTYVAEWESKKSSGDEKIYHIIEWNKTSGRVRACTYNDFTASCEGYKVHPSAHDGAPILFAMMLEFLEDGEFRTALDDYAAQRKADYPSLDVAKNAFAIICDNIYRRVLSTDIPHNIDSMGSTIAISIAELETGTLACDPVIGQFHILASDGDGVAPKVASTSVAPKEDYLLKDFRGVYKTRELTPAEEALVPGTEDDEKYVVSPEIATCAKAVHMTKGVRNILLRGPAGTGKTSGAKAIAAGLGLPYVKYTCSADSEIFDFIGQIIPDVATAGSNEELEKVEKLGGITTDNVAKLLSLPSFTDMEFDAPEAYKDITGYEKESATPQECMKEYTRVLGEKMQELLKLKYQNETATTGARYSYAKTDFLKGLENGWVIEIQEPTIIVRPGVLVGLNSLLEQGGTITLPDGRVITRHPDAVVIVTTNITYEGCRGLNQSVIDRMNLVMDINAPDDETLVKRAMLMTGEEDEDKLQKMITVICNIEEFCRKNCITDGITGQRTLFDWVNMSSVLGSVYKAGLITVVSKATSDPDDQARIIVSCLDPVIRK